MLSRLIELLILGAPIWTQMLNVEVMLFQMPLEVGVLEYLPSLGAPILHAFKVSLFQNILRSFVYVALKPTLGSARAAFLIPQLLKARSTIDLFAHLAHFTRKPGDTQANNTDNIFDEPSLRMILEHQAFFFNCNISITLNLFQLLFRTII